MSKKSMKQFNERKTAQKPMQNVQPKKVKKREVEAWVLAIFMIAWTVCSVLGTIGFCRTQASADSVEIASIEEETAVDCSTAYSSKRVMSSADISNSGFQGTWFFDLPYIVGMSIPSLNNNRTILGIFTLCFTGNMIELNCEGSNFSYDIPLNGSEQSLLYHYRSLSIGGVGSALVSYDYDSTMPNPFVEGYLPSNISLSYAVMPFYQSNGASYNDYSIRLNIQWENGDNVSQSILEFLFASDYDVTSTLSAVFPYYGAVVTTAPSAYNRYAVVGTSTWIYDRFYRYALELPSGSYGAGYDEGFKDGRDTGLSEGRDLGFDAGYQNGRTEGFNAGKVQGFTDGVASANEYSFSGLIGSVLDAPISAIFGTVDENGIRQGGLLNFNILGVDLTGFFMSLLSVMLILSVVKLIMP